MWRGVVERGPLAVPSRMLKLQFILSTLELSLKENGEIKEVRSFPFQLQRFTRDHHIWRRAQEHYEFRFLLTRSTQSGCWFIYTLLCWSACGTIMCRCIFSCMQCFLLMRVCGCVSASVYARVCVCFEICASLLCLSSKGFSPDNVMSGCVSSTNPSLDSNISSQSETPSSLCCVPSFHIQQH